MAKLTLRERFLLALESRGWQRDPAAKSRRYITLYHPEKNPAVKLYIGKSGAFRIGRSVVNSIPVPEGRRRQILGYTAQV